MKPIPYGKQHISQSDIVAVIEVLKSDYLTQGPAIKMFEDAFAQYVGSKYAVAVANGTTALHLCALSLGVKKGDKVITSPITFVASANCVKYCGGEVVFSDIDSQTLLLDLDGVRALLANDMDKEIKGIIPVDFSGRAVNMQAFRELADEYGCWLIEDACHAPGAFFINKENNQSSCGSGQYADLAIFSFHPVKHIAAGEGGMITTNNVELYEKLLKLRTHGITKNEAEYHNPLGLALGNNLDSASKTQGYPGWYMEMQDLGYNYRLTDIQAALGMSQLKRADVGLRRRKEIADKYFKAFESEPHILGQSGVIKGHAYHLYIIEVEDRLGLYNYLREHQVFTQIHYFPTHLMPFYQGLGWKKGDFPKAEAYYNKCISLPIFPALTNEEQDFVINTIKNFYN